MMNVMWLGASVVRKEILILVYCARMKVGQPFKKDNVYAKCKGRNPVQIRIAGDVL